MSDLEKVVEALNLPKLVIEKVDRFLSALLGPSVTETGQLLADKVRFRRWRNQVRVLQKAEALLAEVGAPPREVPLKTLVPLLEAASLEEAESLQDMWAGLLASSTLGKAKCALQPIGVQVLRTISPDEANALQRMFFLYQDREAERLRAGDKEEYPARRVVFRIRELFEGSVASDKTLVLLVDNLVRLNMIERDGGIRSDKESIVNLTDLGLAVLAECNFAKSNEDCMDPRVTIGCTVPRKRVP